MTSEFSDLVGKTLTSIDNIGNEEIVFRTDQGQTYMLYHSQDCCEDVSFEEVTQ